MRVAGARSVTEPSANTHAARPKRRRAQRPSRAPPSYASRAPRPCDRAEIAPHSQADRRSNLVGPARVAEVGYASAPRRGHGICTGRRTSLRRVSAVRGARGRPAGGRSRGSGGVRGGPTRRSARHLRTHPSGGARTPVSPSSPTSSSRSSRTSEHPQRGAPSKAPPSSSSTSAGTTSLARPAMNSSSACRLSGSASP